MRLGLREYLKWLTSGEDHVTMLCRSGAPAWVVHAEQGDGGLTDTERRTLEACPTVEIVTIPGKVFFLPNEVPGNRPNANNTRPSGPGAAPFCCALHEALN